MTSNLNQICVIDGDYKMKTGSPQAGKRVSTSAKLNSLIERYKAKLGADSPDEFVLVHSKDGSELCSSLLQGLGVADFETTLVNATLTCSETSKSGCTSQRFSHNNLASSFVCFVVSDFDQNDLVFIKLEETQTKLASLYSSLNSSNITAINTNNTLTNASISFNSFHKRFMIFGWPVIKFCMDNNLVTTIWSLNFVDWSFILFCLIQSLNAATEVERPLYCKLMSGCFVCFTGFRKENKHTVAYCIKLVHYMGGSVRKEYNKRITHLIVKSTLSTKYKVFEFVKNSLNELIVYLNTLILFFIVLDGLQYRQMPFIDRGLDNRRMESSQWHGI